MFSIDHCFRKHEGKHYIKLKNEHQTSTNNLVLSLRNDPRWCVSGGKLYTAHPGLKDGLVS